jgi:putative ABC transport system ATP-binding protein
MLELLEARKYYASPGGEVHAVDDLSMSIAEREFVAIFGPSGSGKTTLLLLASGLLRADSGRVLFEGEDLSRMPRRDVLVYRRTKLGFVFQDFKLSAGLTAEDNAAIPLLLGGMAHRHARARALAVLADVGLEHRARHTPAELSGGEQQRLAIARALVGKPRLILADEPTGNLDSTTGNAVLELLSALGREHGAAVVLVSHDARVARYADRVLGMRDGRLADPELQEQETIGR